MIKKQPNSAIVPGTGPHLFFDHHTKRCAITARGDKQHHKVLNRTGQHDPASSHSVPGGVAHLRGENRTHQRASTGDSGEVVTVIRNGWSERSSDRRCY